MGTEADTVCREKCHVPFTIAQRFGAARSSRKSLERHERNGTHFPARILLCARKFGKTRPALSAQSEEPARDYTDFALALLGVVQLA